MALLSRFRDDVRANLSITVAFIGLPITLGALASVDITAMVRERTNLQSAVDAAALAAIVRGELTPGEREAFARAVFSDNMQGREGNVVLHTTSTEDSLTLGAEMAHPTFTGKLIFKDGITLRAEGSATLTQDKVVCLLALDPHADAAIHFKDDAEFVSPSCTVQANSRAREAIRSETPARHVAKQFCATGGIQGAFEGVVKSGCRGLDDPYAGRIPPLSPGCGKVTDAVHSIADVVIKRDTLVTPGVYCNGLKFDGVNIKLLPGVYEVHGELVFTSDSNVRGDDVTFVLLGDGKIKMDGDAKVTLSAPPTGKTAGLVFWQHRPTGDPVPSEIATSKHVRLTGTSYLPRTDLKVVSEKKFASSAPATSFIVNTVEFGGASYTQLETDHQAAGLPPILPRTDKGARLMD